MPAPRVAFALLLTLLASSVAAQTPPRPAPKSSSPIVLKPGGFGVLDLTWTFDQSTLYWPTAPSRFELTRLYRGQTSAGYFYSAYSFCTPEDGGTNLDAPIHFAELGWTTDQIPVERLMGPGVVIDVAEKCAKDPDYALQTTDIEAFERAHGRIPRGAMVLLRTGWGQRWPDPKSYLGDDTPGDATRLHFPSYGPEAARFLILRRKVAVLGVDTASLDPGNSRSFAVHVLAAKANVSGLENLARLERLPPTGAWIIALPVKVGGGAGGPVRVVALLPR